MEVISELSKYRSALKTIKHSYQADGVFAVVMSIENGNGEIKTISKQVKIEQTTVDNSLIHPLLLAFTDGDNPLDIRTYFRFIGEGTPIKGELSFGDGTVIPLVTPKQYQETLHTFSTAGTYNLKLVIWDGEGNVQLIPEKLLLETKN